MGVLTLSMKRLDRKKQREEKKRAWMREEMHRLAASLEHEKVDEYMTYLTDPKRMLWKNFVGGVARGLGMAVGFSLLGALLIYVLQKVGWEKIPFIGDMINDIMNIIENKL